MPTASVLSDQRAPAKQPQGRLPQGTAFAGTAAAFVSLYLAAGAPTPLLAFYLRQWNFAPPLLTLAFAVYAGGFLAALLTVGSLSDHIGRRPVLLGALLVQLGSMIMFLSAADIRLVIAARIVQGAATGAATTAFSATLVELAPLARKNLGTILGSVGMAGGLAVGALLSGVAIEYSSQPNNLVFISLAVITVLGIIVVVFAPDTAQRRAGALRSLIPRSAIPRAARAEFAAAAPAVAAAWMLAGLSLGLAPAIVRNVFHFDSGLVNGLASFVGPIASAVAGLAFIRVDGRSGMILGILASIIGTAGILAGILAGSIGLMIAGQILGGIGFGAAFSAALRLIIPLVSPEERGATVASIYIVAYLAFSVPVVLVGLLAASVGLLPAVAAYAIATCLLGSISLFGQAKQHQRQAPALVPRPTA
ncbi:MFS transporter [Arthrobacter sp. ISL-28]|uniref:MFS transporter n=1 Tax=Arthrobacter sp. ISL-28 TaxID=2819108 RepID=UPI001BEBD6CA|nr:MFS transporter [Arthrobacter sp. ISL-28]MBT2522512.1 MFS transporter [Arthrobacter sp. ISL-28]